MLRLVAKSKIWSSLAVRGNYLNDWVVERGHDVSGQNTGKTRDLITLGSPDVAGSATEIFSCDHAVCCTWDGPAYNYKIAGQNYDVRDVVADDLTGAFSSDLNRGATELSDFVFVSFLASTPKTRSNTTSDRDLNRIVFHDVILSSTCPACPRILPTSPNKRQIDQRSSPLDELSTSRTTMRRMTTCPKRFTR